MTEDQQDQYLLGRSNCVKDTLKNITEKKVDFLHIFIFEDLFGYTLSKEEIDNMLNENLNPSHICKLIPMLKIMEQIETNDSVTLPKEYQPDIEDTKTVPLEFRKFEQKTPGAVNAAIQWIGVEQEIFTCQTKEMPKLTLKQEQDVSKKLLSFSGQELNLFCSYENESLQYIQKNTSGMTTEDHSNEI